MLIETWGVWDGLAWVLWGAGQDQGLWAVEGGRVADLASLVGVGLKSLSAGVICILRLEKYLHP